jgi:hypothetical protein
MLDNRGSLIASLLTLEHVVNEFLKTATSRHNDVHVIGLAHWEISQLSLLRQLQGFTLNRLIRRMSTEVNSDSAHRGI